MMRCNQDLSGRLAITPVVTAQDRAELNRVHWQTWHETYAGILEDGYLQRITPDAVAEINARRGTENTLLARLDGQVIGYGSFGECDTAEYGACGEVYALYVLRSHQGMGVGARLMQALLAGLAPWANVILWVHRDNAKAIARYDRYGFRPDGAERQICYGRPETLLRMHRRKPDFPVRLGSRCLYESDWVELHQDQVRMPGGRIIPTYHRLRYPHESVSVVIFNERDEILLIRSKRYVTGRLEWEVPAGRVETGETPEEAAFRECREETGCTLREIRRLCSYHPSNGMSELKMHLFAARVDRTEADADADEVADRRWMTREQALQLLRDNQTRCGVSMLALLYAMQFGA